MCNIAGYVGKEQAAPILLDMMSKEEGFDAGYYTGIATIHEGKLHYRKVCGGVKELIATTDALDLPGTIGIIQGRSRCGDYGGDESWAHPFINPNGNFAYLANGIMSGFFKDVTDMSAQAKRLYEKGYEFTSSCTHELLYFYPSYKEGYNVHASEIMCFLIDEQKKMGYSDAEAVERAFCENPSEIVGLMLSEDNPDQIIVGRVNFPMWIGHGDGEMFLATTAMVFDKERVRQRYSLPTCSVIEVERENIHIHPFKMPFVKVYDKDPKEKLMAAYVEALKEGPKTLYPLGAAAEKYLPEGEFKTQKEVYEMGMIPSKGAIYEVLTELHDRGCIKIDKELWPGCGARPDLKRETFVVSLTKEP